MNSFREIFLESLTNYWHLLAAAMPKILAGLVLFCVFLIVSSIIKRVLRRTMVSRMEDKLLGNFLTIIIRWIVIVIGFSLTLKVMGFGSVAGGVLAGAGVGAFIVGFAFKDIGENFLAGVLMAFSRPFKIGDLVDVNGVVGSVVALDLRNTHVKTADGKDVYIPNGSVIKNNLFNHTIDGFMRHDFTLGIDQYNDYDKAIEIVSKVLSEVEGVLWDRRRPVVMLTGTDANAVLISAYYWVDTFDKSISVAKIKTNALGRSIKVLMDKGFYLPNSIVEVKNYKGKTMAFNSLNL